jgi:hypothetical protein
MPKDPGFSPSAPFSGRVLKVVLILAFIADAAMAAAFIAQMVAARH